MRISDCSSDVCSSDLTIYEQYDSYIYFSYNETRTLFSYNMELDVSKCLIIEKSMQKSKNEYSLLPKIEEVQTLNIEAAESNLDLLVSNLSEKKSTEKRLLNVETKVKSTQNANFDLNETIFDRIASCIIVRNEPSFTNRTRME